MLNECYINRDFMKRKACIEVQKQILSVMCIYEFKNVLLIKTVPKKVSSLVNINDLNR